MAEASSPHVVVTDIGLPGMNGLETTAYLKAMVPATSVVVFSDYEAEAYYAHAIASGASACVTKNMITELQSTLAELLFPQTNRLDTNHIDDANAPLITG